MEKAISNFMESYNALYLTGMSYEQIQELRSSLNNPILVKLIDNLYVPKTYITKYIEGPMSFYKFKLDIEGIPKRSFYLFGEIHRKNTAGSCIDASITFPEYIKRLSESSPSFFDLYIETTMIRSTKPVGKNLSHYDFLKGDPIHALSNTIKLMIKSPNSKFMRLFKLTKDAYPQRVTTSSILSKISSEFLNCIQPSTRSLDDRCNIMRIHTIDTRTSWLSELINDVFYYRVILEILVFRNDSEAVKLNLLSRIENDKVIELLSKLIIGDEVAVQNILDIVINHKYTKKEFDKIDEGLQSTIREYFISKISKLNSSRNVLAIKSLISDLRNQSLISGGWNIIVGQFILSFLSYTMDIYCLSRIFKKHKVEDAYQPQESINVIVYSGNDHTQVYREFFQFIGIRETYSYINPLKKSCVEIIKEKPEEKQENYDGDSLWGWDKKIEDRDYEEETSLWTKEEF